MIFSLEQNYHALKKWLRYKENEKYVIPIF